MVIIQHLQWHEKPLENKSLSRGVIRKSACILVATTIRKSQPGATVKKNPSKRLFSTQAGKEKRGYPSPESVGDKRPFNIDKEGWPLTKVA